MHLDHRVPDDAADHRASHCRAHCGADHFCAVSGPDRGTQHVRSDSWSDQGANQLGTVSGANCGADDRGTNYSAYDLCANRVPEREAIHLSPHRRANHIRADLDANKPSLWSRPHSGAKHLFPDHGTDGPADRVRADCVAHRIANQLGANAFANQLAHHLRADSVAHHFGSEHLTHRLAHRLAHRVADGAGSHRLRRHFNVRRRGISLIVVDVSAHRHPGGCGAGLRRCPLPAPEQRQRPCAAQEAQKRARVC